MDADQRILEKFIQDHPGDVLILIENLREEEIISLLQSLNDEPIVSLLTKMDRFKSTRCLEALGVEKSADLLEKMPIAIAELLLRSLEKSSQDAILNHLSHSTAQALKRVLSYPKNVVGAYLNPDTFTLTEDLTIDQACERVRQQHSSALPHLFVLDRDHILKGYIEMKALITTEPSKLIRSIMNKDCPGIIADMNISVLLEGKGWQEPFSYLPIVDSDHIFLGSISRESLLAINLKKKPIDRQALQASSALGDLYQIGLTGLLRNSVQIS